MRDNPTPRRGTNRSVRGLLFAVVTASLAALVPPAAADNEPPDAGFTYTPASPSTSRSVKFVDTSFDPDGTIVAWAWSFGDGATSSAKTPRHRFDAAGSYTVTLNVTDDGGATASHAEAISVAQGEAPPSGATIQEMVDAAQPGGEVLVPEGNYAESVYVDKPLAIRGDGRVGLNGGSDPAFTIVGARVFLGNLAVRSLGPAIVLQDAPRVDLNHINVLSDAALDADNVTWIHWILPANASTPTAALRNASLVHIHETRLRLLDTEGGALTGISYIVTDGTRTVAAGVTDEFGRTATLHVAHETVSPLGTTSNETFLRVGDDAEAYPVDSHAGEGTLATLVAPAGDSLAAQVLEPEIVIAVAAATVGVSALAVAFQLHEGFRWRWLLWFAPLYTRFAKSEILEHGVRETVYGYIEANPGAHLRGIKRELAVKHGTLLHHLQMLEHHRYVKSVRDGMYRRYFVAGAAPRFEGQQQMSQLVLDYVRDHPGTTNAAVAAALGKRPSLVHYHVQRLAEAGRLRKEGAGRDVRLHYGPAESPSPSPIANAAT